MNKEQELIDSLLKEHAKMKKKGNIDKRFLKELEEKIDAIEEKENALVKEKANEDSESDNQRSEQRKKVRLIVGLGIAASIAIGYMSVQQWGGKPRELAVNEKGAEQNTSQAMEDHILGEIRITNENNAEEINHRLKRAKSLDLEYIPYSGGSRGGDMAILDKKVATSRATAKRKHIARSELFAQEKQRRGVTNHSTDFAKTRVFLQEDEELQLAQLATTVDDCHQTRGRTDQKGNPIKDSSESYAEITENGFIAPIDKDSRRSTFAVDVDTASYANIRRIILSGNEVPKNAVRIEEMVNYFDYQYNKPKGEHPFSVQLDAVTCPWDEGNKLVRIAISGKDIQRVDRPACNLVFLIDVSGSMQSSDKLPLLKESFNYLLEELNEKDTVSMVVYAGSSGVVLPPTKVDDAGRKLIFASLEKLSAGGSTAGGEGIKLAYKVAQDSFIKEGVNRVILATDGDFNVGVSDSEELKKLVSEKAKKNVYLSALGFGSGNLNDKMLELITNHGNGNYSYIDSVKEGRKVLLEDMIGTLVTIAKDVKVRVEFNPDKVKEYRLIGYANRVLPNAAFLDKKADAGEIGAGHQVTAFYEVVPGKAEKKPALADFHFDSPTKKEETHSNKVPAEHQNKLLIVDLAYKRADQKMNDQSTYLSVALDDKHKHWKDADKDFKFASSVALFGMILSDSDYEGKGDLKLVEKLALLGKGDDGKGYRQEFLNLVKKQATLGE